MSSTRHNKAIHAILAATTLLTMTAGAPAALACPPSETTDPFGRPDTSHVDACAEPVIQLAILLDTSGSMEGLINQARSRIWDVVNDLSKARRNGRRARLEVALYQYGSDKLPSSCEGFMRLVQPFTTDLDLLSEQLFSLSVGGSAEFCGWVMQSAMRGLSWDPTPTSRPLDHQPLRVVVIAGNEPFTQGPVDYVFPVEGAKDRGVIVNTIYCGPAHEGAHNGWHDAASRGCGKYLFIDHNQEVGHVLCPQDDEMLRLNSALNRTYVTYVPDGSRFQARQEAQDATNRALSQEGAVARIQAKAGAAYDNSHWDLIDAVEQGKDIAAVPTESLPPAFRSLTIDERKQEVARLTKERDQLKDRIRELAAERERFLTERRQRDHRAETLDTAIVRALREQAKRLGFVFDAD